MPFSELIKDFDRIRDYLRDFYVYGFKHREEFTAKSARSYDNERRRVESWLGDCMSFRQNSEGKAVFISIDSREVARNPLYKAFKTKSFTSNDIMLNFIILDLLGDGASSTISEIVEGLEDEHMFEYDNAPLLDESTIRQKLSEYSKMGLLTVEKRGKRLYYKINYDSVPLQQWADALSFYSEEDPLGVIGSYLLDKLEDAPGSFRFKHHYILHALESEVLCDLFLAIGEKQRIVISTFNQSRLEPSEQNVTPLKIYISTQSGRRYLLAYSHKTERMQFFRLDNIREVRPRHPEREYDEYKIKMEGFERHLWGVSTGIDGSTDHVELTLFAGPDEKYIVDRLERERRCGSIEYLGDNLYRFTVDVYDSAEMLPWIRTFIGRIVSFECSNEQTVQTFFSDLKKMFEIYGTGGETDVIS